MIYYLLMQDKSYIKHVLIRWTVLSAYNGNFDIILSKKHIMNQRLDYIDEMKGLAILLVVLGHLFLPHTSEGHLHPFATMIYYNSYIKL